jgi:hypothetical protein
MFKYKVSKWNLVNVYQITNMNLESRSTRRNLEYNFKRGQQTLRLIISRRHIISVVIISLIKVYCFTAVVS